MKTSIGILRLALSALGIVSLLLYSSCGPTIVEPTPQEEVTALLVGKTWKVQSVSVAGVDKSSMFTGMTLAFTEAGVTVANGGPVWAGVTSWTWANTEATTFKRNDDVEVDIEATETTLKLTLTWTKTTLGPGRTNSVAGVHVFNFGL